jgi:hypothetical protein
LSHCDYKAVLLRVRIPEDTAKESELTAARILVETVLVLGLSGGKL